MDAGWSEIAPGVWRRDTVYVVAVQQQQLRLPFVTAVTNRVVNTWSDPLGHGRYNLAREARDAGYEYNGHLVPSVYIGSAVPPQTTVLCRSGYMQSIGGGGAKYDSLYGLWLTAARLQARGHFGALVRAARCVNMTFSAKPAGRIALALDLAAFKDTSVHGAHMVYKPDVMRILRIRYAGPGADDARNTIRVSLFENGEMLIAGPDEAMFPTVAAWTFRLVADEYVRQHGEAVLAAKLAAAAARGYVLDPRDSRASAPDIDLDLGSDPDSDSDLSMSAGARARQRTCKRARTLARKRKRKRVDSDSDSAAETREGTCKRTHAHAHGHGHGHGTASASGSANGSASGSASASDSASDSENGLGAAAML